MVTLDPDPQIHYLNSATFTPPEIYRIVSQKALDNGDSAQATLGQGTGIDLRPSKGADEGANKGGKCC